MSVTQAIVPAAAATWVLSSAPSPSRKVACWCDPQRHLSHSFTNSFCRGVCCPKLNGRLLSLTISRCRSSLSNSCCRFPLSNSDEYEERQSPQAKAQAPHTNAKSIREQSVGCQAPGTSTETGGIRPCVPRRISQRGHGRAAPFHLHSRVRSIKVLESREVALGVVR